MEVAQILEHLELGCCIRVEGLQGCHAAFAGGCCALVQVTRPPPLESMWVMWYVKLS